MRASVRIVGLALILMLVAAACGGDGEEGEEGTGPTGATGVTGVQGGSYTVYNCEPQSLIPHNDYESCGAQAFEALWTRLVSFDPETLDPVPAQAESISVSEDGLTYTIAIKPGWTFHNGEPVTAQSYVDAWNFTAYGPNGYILNFFFERIDGYDELNPRKGEPAADELSGLEVVDDTTFNVTLTAPFSPFESQLGFDAFDPLPQVFYEDPEAFNEQPIGDGPYMMDGPWLHDETVNLKRYEGYGGTPGLADTIELRIYQTSDTAWLDFQAGELDVVLVGSDHLTEAREQYADVLSEDPGATILFLGVPLYDERFADPALRQALSMAVDRQAVMDAILIAETPADDFAPPGVAGYRQGACTYCVYDPEAARQKLEEAGGWSGEMTLNFYEDVTLQQAMEAVANQWRDNLGIDVKLNATPFNPYLDLIYGFEMDGPWWDGWTQDYPNLQDFLQPIYGSTGGANTSGYSSQAFDDLLTQGDLAGPDASIPIYQQADDVILEDMPSIPWGYIGFNTAHSEKVTNVLKVPGLDLWALESVQVVG